MIQEQVQAFWRTEKYPVCLGRRRIFNEFQLDTGKGFKFNQAGIYKF
jgi:hypothetical protein